MMTPGKWKQTVYNNSAHSVYQKNEAQFCTKDHTVKCLRKAKRSALDFGPRLTIPGSGDDSTLSASSTSRLPTINHPPFPRAVEDDRSSSRWSTFLVFNRSSMSSSHRSSVSATLAGNVAADTGNLHTCGVANKDIAGQNSSLNSNYPISFHRLSAISSRSRHIATRGTFSGFSTLTTRSTRSSPWLSSGTTYALSVDHSQRTSILSSASAFSAPRMARSLAPRSAPEPPCAKPSSCTRPTCGRTCSSWLAYRT